MFVKYFTLKREIFLTLINLLENNDLQTSFAIIYDVQTLCAIKYTINHNDIIYTEYILTLFI